MVAGCALRLGDGMIAFEEDKSKVVESSHSCSATFQDFACAKQYRRAILTRGPQS
jgi:hypothetical protein